LTRALATPWEALALVIPDEQVLIEKTLRKLCDAEGCCLVVTTAAPARHCAMSRPKPRWLSVKNSGWFR